MNVSSAPCASVASVEEACSALRAYNGVLSGRLTFLDEPDRLLDGLPALAVQLSHMGEPSWADELFAEFAHLFIGKEQRDVDRKGSRRARKKQANPPPPVPHGSDAADDAEDEVDAIAEAELHLQHRSAMARRARKEPLPSTYPDYGATPTTPTTTTSPPPASPTTLRTPTTIAQCRRRTRATVDGDVISISSSSTLVPDSPGLFPPSSPGAPPRPPESTKRVTILTPEQLHMLEVAGPPHASATSPGKRESDVHRTARLAVPIRVQRGPRNGSAPESPGLLVRRGGSLAPVGANLTGTPVPPAPTPASSPWRLRGSPPTMPTTPATPTTAGAAPTPTTSPAASTTSPGRTAGRRRFWHRFRGGGGPDAEQEQGRRRQRVVEDGVSLWSDSEDEN